MVRGNEWWLWPAREVESTGYPPVSGACVFDDLTNVVSNILCVVLSRGWNTSGCLCCVWTLMCLSLIDFCDCLFSRILMLSIDTVATVGRHWALNGKCCKVFVSNSLVRRNKPYGPVAELSVATGVTLWLLSSMEHRMPWYNIIRKIHVEPKCNNVDKSEESISRHSI